MITGDELEQVVYGYWAKHFDCDREDFDHAGTLVIKEEQLDETRKTHIYHIDRMSIVRAAPALVKQAGLPDGYDRDFGSLTVDKLKGLIAEGDQVELESTFLDCYLDPQDFSPFTVGRDFSTRRLHAENDNSILLGLYGACSEEELDAADINIEEPDPVIYGIFAGGQLVAYASHRYWDDVIADMGVLVHPGYRGRGFGKAVVSALCEWCIGNRIVSMYRVFQNHSHSLRLAHTLGFKELVVIETVKIMARDPG